MDMAVPNCAEKLRNAWSTYINKVTDIEVTEPRSLYCASAVNQLLGMHFVTLAFN